MKHEKLKTAEGKHIPLRTCIACRSVKPKAEMIRAEIPGTGRGAYLCRSEACVEKAIRERGLNRAFRRQVPEEVYLRLKENTLE